MEWGNAFSELTIRWTSASASWPPGTTPRPASDEAHPMDEDFVTALEHGMPPTGGLGLASTAW